MGLDEPLADDQKKAVVIKRNELIHGHYNLSVFAQKTVAALISRLDPTMEGPLQEYRYSVSTFADIMGVTPGRVYQVLPDVMEELQQQTATLAEPDPGDKSSTNDKGPQSFRKINWFQHSRYLRSEGIIAFKWHQDMEPYLRDLTANYTKYHWIMVQKLRSAFSIRMYEILRSYLSLRYIEQGEYYRTKNIDYKGLRKMLGIADSEYQRFYDFQKYVLKASQKELREKTDLDFEFSFPERKTKNSRKPITVIRFDVRGTQLQTLINAMPKWRQDLIKFVSDRLIEKMLDKYGLEQVERNAQYVLMRLSDDNQPEVEAPSAYFRKAVDLDYAGMEQRSEEKAERKDRLRSRLRDIGDMDW